MGSGAWLEDGLQKKLPWQLIPSLAFTRPRMLTATRTQDVKVIECIVINVLQFPNCNNTISL